MRKPLPGNRGSREDLGKGKGVEVKNTAEFEFPQLLVIDARRGHDDSFGTGRIKPRGLFNEFQISGLRRNPDLPELLFVPFPMTDPDAMPSYARAGEGGYMVWCDIDHKHLSAEQWELLDELDAEIIASGTPGHYQVFVHLDSATPAHHVEALNRALCEKLDGDPSKVVRSAIMRLPGGYNTKGGKRRRAMRMRDSLTLWSAPELAQMLGTELPRTDARTRVQSVSETPTEPTGQRRAVLKNLARIADQKERRVDVITDRSNLAYGLWRDCHSKGYSPEEALWAGLQSEALTSKWTGRQIAEDIARVYGKLGPQAIETEEAEVPEAQPKLITGDEFWEARPILTHIRDFARARIVSPWALLGAVMARVAAVIPHSVKLPPTIGSPASLNLYVGIVDPSGGGKGAAISSARYCLDLPGTFPSINLGSGEGIAHQFMERKDGELVQHTSSVLFQVNEIDSLTAMQGRSASTITPMLCQAWMGEELGFAYVDKAKRLPMEEHSYRLGLICGIQPERAQPLIKSADSGLAQRFVWLPAMDLNAPEFNDDMPDVEPWPWELPRLGHAFVPVPGAIRREIRRAHHERLTGRAQINPLDGHKNLARLKTATILGFLDGRAEVTDVDWELAGMVMAVSVATRTEVVDTIRRMKADEDRERGQSKGRERAAANDEELNLGDAKRWALEKIQEKGQETAGELKRRCPKRLKEHLQTALESLESGGKIKAQEGARKDSITWRAV